MLGGPPAHAAITQRHESKATRGKKLSFGSSIRFYTLGIGDTQIPGRKRPGPGLLSLRLPPPRLDLEKRFPVHPRSNHVTFRVHNNDKVRS